MATAKYRHDAAGKLLERLLSHPAWKDGLPVRFRCDPSLTKPDRFGRHRRRHTASTLRPHFIHICAPKASQKCPKPPFCAPFAPPAAQKARKNEGF
jgi:hypothetical protein